MRIKEIDRTANVAWSPAVVQPIYLCAGTAAQQLDATFSTTSALEIYELNVEEPGLDMLLKGSIATEHRFHKVSWGAFGLHQREMANGVVVGGCDAGHMFVYSAARLVDGSTGDALVVHKDKHTGPIRALDFNVFQENLLASGASDSEILIWDLNNVTAPMTPGAKSQPADDVTCIAWNCQVQHILASTFGTRCVVWDLRKNEPIIKVSGSTSRMRCKVVSWHPNVATQMCLASEDDHTPFIQLWDLRFATSPLKTFESHQRGILSLSWCHQDPDLLLSCGKDCRIICWNPNCATVGGEVVCEIPTSNQWSFDVDWCPRNPALLSSCSFDGHVSVYSVLGGTQHVAPNAKITEAFMDSGYQMQQAPSIAQTTTAFYLKKAPKWLQSSVGARFGFGGRLVSFVNEARAQQQQALVFVSQVITEPSFIVQAGQLEEALSSGRFADFCQNKVDHATSEDSHQLWSFLQAHFDADPKFKFLSLLGHATEASLPDQRAQTEDSVRRETPPFAETAFDAFSTGDVTISTGSDTTTGRVSQLLLSGQLESAIDACMKENLMVEALLLAMSGDKQLLTKIQRKYFSLKASDSLTQLIAAVVTRNWSEIVTASNLSNWKESLSGAMVYSEMDEFTRLCEVLGERLEQEEKLHEATVCYICSANVAKLVDCWSKASSDVSSPGELQNIVEQVAVLKRIPLGLSPTNDHAAFKKLSEVLYRYASYLASQGKLSMALSHLEPSEEEAVTVLQNRLSRALDLRSAATDNRTAAQKTWQPVQPHQQLPVQSHAVRPLRQETPKYTVPTPVQPYAQGPLAHRYPPVENVPMTPTNFGPYGYAQPAFHTSYGAVPPPPMTPTGQVRYSYEPPGPYALPDENVPAPRGVPQPLIPVTGTYGTVAQPFTDVRSGWNDPPLVTRPVQHELQQPPAPITHPLFGVALDAATPPYYDQPQYDTAGGSLPPPTHLIEPSSAPGLPPAQRTVVKPQRAIPAEHAILQTYFEDIRSKCLESNLSPTLKRKLEDVARKLEVLYEKLRDDELSPATTLGLHQIVQVVQQQQDYQMALHIHTQMVGTGTFSEIGGFMPGLKVLLQTAQQLSIYV